MAVASRTETTHAWLLKLFRRKWSWKLVRRRHKQPPDGKLRTESTRANEQLIQAAFSACLQVIGLRSRASAP
jgi:hypothetical protein